MTDQKPLVGEILALDMINTYLAGPSEIYEFLSNPQELEAWLDLERSVRPDIPEDWRELPDDLDLRPILAIRAISREAIAHARGGRPAPAPLLQALIKATEDAPTYVAVTDNEPIPKQEVRYKGPLNSQIAAWMARATIDLLCSGQIEKVRECAADDCVILFLPKSHRRQWCSADRCGNRARVSRYYHRHKDG